MTGYFCVVFFFFLFAVIIKFSGHNNAFVDKSKTYPGAKVITNFHAQFS